MRLLYITAGYPFGGTAESFLEPELAELAALGVEVDVLPVRRGGDARAMPPGVRLRPETLAGAWRGALRGRRLRGLARLLPVLARSPRALARNAAVLPLTTSVAAAIHDEAAYDHIHAHWLSHTSTCALGISELTGTPFSITAHRWDVYVENLFATKARRASFVRFIARRCRAAFEAQVGAGTGRLVDLHMGVEAVGGPSTPHVGDDGVGPTRLVAVGSLLPVKGQRHLVEAVAQLRDRGVDTSLDIYGGGPLHDELSRQVSDLGLDDRVVLRGVRPRDELAAAYARGDYDVFVMPSVDLGGGEHEGVPVSIMEAMAVGVPVVATHTGGIPELVVDGVTGLLVPQQSPSALADAVARISADRGLAFRLGTAGAHHVREEFDAATIARRLLDLMQG